MFETLFVGDGSRLRRLRKALTLFVSLAVHAAAVAAVIVVPLLRADGERPGFAVIDAALLAPPLLPGVPPGSSRPGRGAVRPAGTQGTNVPPPAGKPRGFMAPFEIPTAIGDENPADLLPADQGPGVDGGTGDGTKPWIIGEDVLPDEVKPSETAMTTVRAPRLIRKLNPVYPPLALAAQVAGAVVIEAATDVYGRVREARLIGGHALLNAAALEAVRGWIYEPYLVNGVPHPVRFTVTVFFNLEKR
jgi:protein TonB